MISYRLVFFFRYLLIYQLQIFTFCLFCVVLLDVLLKKY